MNKFLSLIPLLLIALFSLNKMQKANNESLKIKKMSIHEFKVENINGEEFDFSSLKGKKIMVVNTASKCGLTPQYDKLEALYQKFKNDNFVIIGFPSNDFMGQEPGTNEEIMAFCKKNYGVSFPMMSKVKVKGNDKCNVYSFLTSKSKNGLEDNKVQWNFQKYLLDENGFLIKVLSPRTSPDDPQISSWIEGK
ncbi:MAG: glutathione peroxidase [Flavobacteriales bacterium]|nr:MAG: glutathione peroxidase [Flavobacteriales bacterium]